MRMLKFAAKLGLAILLVAAIFATLWFASPYFRAWVRHPLVMYKCKVDLGWPDEFCMGVVTMRELKIGR